MIQLANTNIELVETVRGPEIVVNGTAHLTVFEFEKFLIDAASLARTARAKTSARARHANLPMR